MLLRLLIIAIVAYLLYLLLRKGGGRPGRKAGDAARKSVEGEELVRDPQCGAYVPVGDAQQAVIGGQKLHFCSRACLEQYRNGRSQHQDPIHR